MCLSFELHSFMKSKAKSIALASAVKIEEPSGKRNVLQLPFVKVRDVQYKMNQINDKQHQNSFLVWISKLTLCVCYLQTVYHQHPM